MSGIAGIVAFTAGDPQLGFIGPLTAALQRRGPHGTSLWQSEVAVLGHCMLRATAESAQEHQPLLDGESGLVLVFDGRLDNRDELFVGLGVAGDRHAVPDPVLVMQAFKRWGERCTSRLHGDFALALWDPDHRRLFCARDPMGGAPFSFVRSDRVFAFASEAEALLALPGISRAPNPRLIASLLVPAFDPGVERRTWQENVTALMPGESLRVAADGTLRTDTYWQAGPLEPREYASDEACGEHFRAVFGEAVRCRLRSVADVAAMLSGGLDSAGLATTVYRQFKSNGERRFATFSALDDDRSGSIESRAILSMADSLSIDPHYVSAPSFEGMVGIDDLISATIRDAHPVDNTLLLPAMMALACSRHGGHAILHGASGDVVMEAPQHYMTEYLKHRQVRTAWRECLQASRNNLYLQSQSPVAICLRSGWGTFAPAPLRKLARRLRRPSGKALVARSLINPDLAARLRLAEQLDCQIFESDPVFAADPANALMQRRRQLITSSLSGFGRVTSRYGVESRDPWADFRVVEFFEALPLRFKVRDGWTKYLVRTEFSQELSPDVLWRRDKEHVGWRFTQRLMSELRNEFMHLLEDDLGLIAEYVAPDAVRALMRDHQANETFASRQAVYELGTMILWQKRVQRLSYAEEIPVREPYKT